MHDNNGFNAQLDTSAEFKLQRPPQPRRAPQPVTLTNDRTKQATLFDAGQNDLPG